MRELAKVALAPVFAQGALAAGPGILARVLNGVFDDGLFVDLCVEYRQHGGLLFGSDPARDEASVVEVHSGMFPCFFGG